MKFFGFVMAAAISLAGANAHAEHAENSLHDGMKSLSFAVPNGGNGFAGGAAGYWMMIGDNMNLGLNLGLAFDSGGADTDFDILIAPTLRSYLYTDGEVAPFYFGQVNFRMASIGGGDIGPELGLAGGLGVEWFVTKVFSIAGQVGLGIDLIREGPDPLAFGTFTSAMTAQIYFE